jgi:peptidoglycan/xylan/chitin deacetylase (PgdA/CDA1 family)
MLQDSNVQKVFLILYATIFLWFPGFGFKSSEILKNYNDSIAIDKTIQNLYTPAYLNLKNKLLNEFKDIKPGKFGEFVDGIFVSIDCKEKVIAFTFDACGGFGSSGFNAELIEFLKKEKIPATLFVTGKWIDVNKKTFVQLASDTLFEIENHGLNHKPCTIDGKSAYGISGTNNIGEVIDEIELNALKIEKLTGRKPKFMRSATAYTDEASTKIAKKLGMKMVAYSVLSGDAVPDTPAEIICDNILTKAKPGAIVIMHFNHPKWQEKQALEMAIPKLRKMGYRFVKLENCKLKEAQQFSKKIER